MGLVTVFLLVYLFTRNLGDNTSSVSVTSEQMESLIEAESEMYSVTLGTSDGGSAGTVTADKADGSESFLANVTNVDRFAQKLEEKGIDYNVKNTGNYDSLIATIVPSLITIVAVVMLMRMMMGAAGGQGAKMANFSKSRARLSSDVEITLNDVAGMVSLRHHRRLCVISR